MSCPNKNGLKTILGLRIRYVRKILRRSLDEIIFKPGWVLPKCSQVSRRFNQLSSLWTSLVSTVPKLVRANHFYTSTSPSGGSNTTTVTTLISSARASQTSLKLHSCLTYNTQIVRAFIPDVLRFMSSMVCNWTETRRRVISLLTMVKFWTGPGALVTIVCRRNNSYRAQ